MEVEAVFDELVADAVFSVAQELQEEFGSGVGCLNCACCPVAHDAAVAGHAELCAELATLKHEGLVLRSPMFCDCRRDLVTEPRYDCFGQPQQGIGMGANDVVVCPNCGAKTAAVRFAPHLQRCMGGGRTGTNSRAATRQSRSTTPQNALQPSQGGSGGGGAAENGSTDKNEPPHSIPLRRSLTPPIASSFSAGAAAERLQKSLHDRLVAKGGNGTSARTSVATAKHAPYLAIARAAVRGGGGEKVSTGAGPKASRIGEI
jgi:hypothetical protein